MYRGKAKSVLGGRTLSSIQTLFGFGCGRMERRGSPQMGGKRKNKNIKTSGMEETGGVHIEKRKKTIPIDF